MVSATNPSFATMPHVLHLSILYFAISASRNYAFAAILVNVIFTEKTILIKTLVSEILQ